MHTRKLLPSLIPLLFVLLPSFCQAAGIGDAALLSEPGKPLLARVELQTNPGEIVEDGCLSLLPPDPLSEEIGSFLTDAHLSLKTAQQHTYVEIASNMPTGSAPLRLRLQVKCPNTQGSVKTLTLVASGKAPELAALAEKYRQLEADFSALQQQSRRVQDQMAEIKQQLAALQGVLPAPNLPAPRAVPEEAQKPGSPMQIQQYVEYLPKQTTGALGLLLILFALWLSVHYFTRVKSHLSREPLTAPPPKPWTSTAIKHPAKPSEAHSTPAAAARPPESGISLDMTGKTAAQDDAMLEEAGLYIAVGRLPKAIELLQEVIRHSPAKTDAWSLLFSIYSSQGRAGEFEKTALAFLRHHKDSGLWGQIQVLGRTLDPNNPLYAGMPGSLSATPLLPDALHHPIGDVLIEMGALSKNDILHHLEDFDPKKHGRFGGYLVARKAITLAQLDDALLRQQGVHAEAKAGDLPSLQDIENFLSVFDPKRDGSVGNFLAAHHAATPEMMRKELKHTTAAGQAKAASPQDKASAP